MARYRIQYLVLMQSINYEEAVHINTLLTSNKSDPTLTATPLPAHIILPDRIRPLSPPLGKSCHTRRNAQNDPSEGYQTVFAGKMHKEGSSCTSERMPQALLVDFLGDLEEAKTADEIISTWQSTRVIDRGYQCPEETIPLPSSFAA